MNHMTSKIQGLGTSVPLILFTLLMGNACEPRIIGEAGSGGATGSGGKSGSGGGMSTAGGSTHCDVEDQKKRSSYDAWRAAQNEVSDLAGVTFEGYARGGPDFTLTFTEGGEGAIIVGEAVAPPVDADAGYLCEWNDIDCRYAVLKPGGSYAIRGAKFENNRLRFEFATNAALDTWCQLQTPYDWGGCSYSPFKNGRVSFPGSVAQPEPCSIDTQSVECDWFMPLFEDGVCECTSEACFPTVAAPGESTTAFDATFDATDGTLDGRLGEFDVFLTKVECVESGEGGAAGGPGAGCAA